MIMAQSDKKIVKIPSSITVKKFSELLGMPVTSIITELLKKEYGSNK